MSGFRSIIALALALATGLSCAATRFSAGEYVRIKKSPLFPPGGRETATLRIVSASDHGAKFQLQVTMNPFAEDDGGRTRSGEIENGEAFFNGASAVYRSANPEDKDLGTCILSLRRSGQLVVVRQSGKCWWFGEGVNATGKYRPSKPGEVHVVR